MIRFFFCFGPAFIFVFPLAMIGFPFFLCLIFTIGIFGLGWQVTGSDDIATFNKNNYKEYQQNEVTSPRKFNTFFFR